MAETMSDLSMLSCFRSQTVTQPKAQQYPYTRSNYCARYRRPALNCRIIARWDGVDLLRAERAFCDLSLAFCAHTSRLQQAARLRERSRA